MKKLFAILTLALAGLLLAPAAAHAYPDEAAGTVSDATVGVGDAVIFSGDGFEPGSDITITVSGGDATITPAAATTRVVTASSTGTFRVSIAFQSSGTFTLRAAGTGLDGGPRVVTAQVVVAAAGVVSDGGENLASTGADGTATQVWAGIGLLGLGAGLVALTVSRRRATASLTA